MFSLAIWLNQPFKISNSEAPKTAVMWFHSDKSVSDTSGFHKASVCYHDVSPAELCRPILICPVIYQSAGITSSGTVR